MASFPIPANEEARVRKLREFGIMDTGPDPLFDDLTTAASIICEAPIAYISLIDEDRQWFKSMKGTDLTSTARCDAICSHTIAQSDMLEICDLTKDCRFDRSPYVAGGPCIRFYAGVPLLADDNLAMGSICVIDMRPRSLSESQRKGLEALGRQAVALLNLHRSFSRLSELSRQKDDFIRIASHDLKNPLQSVLMTSSVIQQLAPPGTAVTDQHLQLIGGIYRSANLMKRIIADYLDFQALEDGQLRIALETADLAVLAREVVEDQISYAERKQIRLRAELPPDPVPLQADGARLTQVMHNLVGNAIKFSPAETDVAVCIERDGEQVCFKVRDAGPGLKPEDRSKLFTKYARLSNKPTGNEKSSGLGLAICKSLIDLHGGTIGAENNPGGGSTFFFKLAAQA